MRIIKRKLTDKAHYGVKCCDLFLIIRPHENKPNRNNSNDCGTCVSLTIDSKGCFQTPKTCAERLNDFLRIHGHHFLPQKGNDRIIHFETGGLPMKLGPDIEKRIALFFSSPLPGHKGETG